MQQNSQDVNVASLSLPKGGGTIKGMGGNLNPAGPDGTASLSLPLPISSGRGVAPDLSLTYASRSGNGPFGMGWQCQPTSIRLRSSHGVPRYNDTDTFLDPMGEVLMIAPDDMGSADKRTSNILQGVMLSEAYTVTCYRPRIIYDFSRLEYWQPVVEDTESPFWVMYSPDGQIHIFGKHAHARVANPTNDKQIAQWLLEETVTPSGEHIYYQYRAEDEVGCEQHEKQQHPQASAQRYLAQINYGNITPRNSLFALDEALPKDSQWLFHLVFDYGERDSSIFTVPDFQAKASWNVRPDCFSRFDYGFEVRTRRLCQQVLMFHRLQALAGEDNPAEVPALISRLILGYDLNSSLTLLISVRLLAHEDDDTPVSMPPLEFDYQRLDTTQIPVWQPMSQLAGLNGQQPYQLVDLYGEGLPGVLYQNLPGAWWYRSPTRGEDDAVLYGAMKPLPQIPSQQQAVMLMDINGDGRLDWVVTTPSIRGYHSMEVDRQWSKFIPISALPLEYFHPQAQLADLLGEGLADLVLIGPRSVRLYAKHRDGWHTGVNVIQSGDITLPIPGADVKKLVAFADMLGSGQVHLVEISAVAVRCWPNLGHGCFGPPLLLTGFKPSAEIFNPSQLYLADIDGSGTTDILYAHSNFLELFLNESGNYFRAPLCIPLPPGVRFDRTCLLQIADTQGLGISSLILTVPHMSPVHWRLDLAQHKPWLLNVMNNNLGADTTLFYRSSAQFWLDEKHRAEEKNQLINCHLPFPMHLLWRIEKLDEITGNRLSTVQTYAHGVWDGKEHEFRGFAQVTQIDMDIFAQATNRSVTPTIYPARTINWFATGVVAVDAQLSLEFWRRDEQAFPDFLVRFTRYDNETKSDQVITPKNDESYWLHRAMKGQLLHSEVYADDDSEYSDRPYTIVDNRLQVRRLTGLQDNELSSWISVIETRSYQYERVPCDPRCSQQVVLKSDHYGFPLETVDITYPRRPKLPLSPYPDTLPETLFDSSYDEQQQVLHLTRQRQAYYHLIEKDRQVLGLTDVMRSDAWEYHASEVPHNGLSLETLNAESSLIGPGTTQSFLGYRRVAYKGPDEKPTIPALVAYTEKTAFDEQNLLTFNGVISAEELHEQLIKGGYRQTARPFREEAESDVWVTRQGYTEYAGAETFYRPLAQRNTLLTGNSVLSWDSHYCVVIRIQDAAGFNTEAVYDYRFLTPIRITDINDNQSQVTLTALGQVSSSRFWGWEGNQIQGYTPPEEKPFTLPSSIAEGLALKPGIPVANCMVYALLSWMPSAERISRQEDEVQWQLLREAGVITEDKLICALAYRRWLERQGEATQRKAIQSMVRIPAHILSLATDRYDQDPAQQIGQVITFSDGFGRQLQTAVRHEAGEAWQRAENGSLVTGSDGRPVVIHTENRWAISGRVEYDAKGQLVRAYQPFFLDNWRYLSDDSARHNLYADTYYYDALGREYRVKTAKGYLREGLFTPWFVVNEDENDTAHRVSNQR
ncbi:SpvB/TcaC N-terminal domain-containing protein [Rickettsiella endosymbiont of Rhagonycha lignosa]|uniref:SpvB/TcaC N-terminal domain-containing protein n=1 Tax=Rickettsiella endosymbiont of Rhagonycha lignosa TaxID=3077937 RepID=UPI00313B8A5B